MAKTRMARFIGAKTLRGREILADPLYTRYRKWLGKEVRVDLSTAEFVVNSATGTRAMTTSATETRVEITLPWGETEMVRSAYITGLTATDLEAMHRTALDRRFPTSRMGTATKPAKEEVAPPA